MSKQLARVQTFVERLMKKPAPVPVTPEEPETDSNTNDAGEEEAGDGADESDTTETADDETTDGDDETASNAEDDSGTAGHEDL